MIQKIFTLYFLSAIIIGFFVPPVVAQPFTFAHITDTHVGGSTGAEDLEKTVADINSLPEISFVLVTGDITEFGSGDELRTAKSILDKLNKTWFVVPGNHDSKWSESGCNDFVTIFGSETFAFEKNGYLFVGTSSGPNMRMAPGLVPREQVVWLDSILSNLKNPEQPLIFVNHYPLDESLSNSNKVIQSLKKGNIQLQLLGHGHTNKWYDFQGIPGIMGRSNLKTARTAVGYNLVTIRNDSVFYRERNPGEGSKPEWLKLGLKALAKVEVIQPAPEERNIYRNRGNLQSPPPRLKNAPPATDAQEKVQTKAQAQAKVEVKPSAPEERNSYRKRGRHRSPPLRLKNPRTVQVEDKPDAKVLWKVLEESDIGSGTAVKGNICIYTTTKGQIVARDRRNGSLLWMVQTGGKIYSTPAVAGNRVVCPSTDGKIRCLDLATGKLLWTFATGKPIVASPVIQNNRVFCGSSEGKLRAIKLKTGKLVWQFDSVRNFIETRPLLYDRVVYFGSWGNTFYALDQQTGKLLWKREKYNNRMLSPAAVWPVAADGKIFLVAPDRHFTALDAETGREIWDSGKYSCRESIGISKNGKLVYIKNMTEGNVDAFDTRSDTLQLAWECKADLGYEIAPSPITENRKYVFVPTTSGKIVAIDKKTHQVAWRVQVSEALVNHVLPCGNRHVLVTTMDGHVVCLDDVSR